MSDLISRQAAIDALTKDKKALIHIINGMSGHEKEFDRFIGQRNQVDCDIYAIKQLPSAQPEQREGKWIATHEVTPFSNPDSITYVCSECGHKHYTLYCLKFDMKYCPDCGADMRG